MKEQKPGLTTKMCKQFVNLAILFGFASSFLSCENDVKDVQELANTQNLPLQQGKQVEYIFTDSTRIQYRAFAVEFVESETESGKVNEFPKGGKFISYNKSGAVEWKIQANYAIHTEADQIWELRNDVVATSDDGKTINTELLFWNQKKKIIYSNQYTRIITNDGQVLEGQSFTSDEDMNAIRMKNVSGEIFLEDRNEQ